MRIELEHVFTGEVEGSIVVCERRKGVEGKTGGNSPGSDDHRCEVEVEGEGEKGGGLFGGGGGGGVLMGRGKGESGAKGESEEGETRRLELRLDSKLTSGSTG